MVSEYNGDLKDNYSSNVHLVLVEQKYDHVSKRTLLANLLRFFDFLSFQLCQGYFD